MSGLVWTGMYRYARQPEFPISRTSRLGVQAALISLVMSATAVRAGTAQAVTVGPTTVDFGRYKAAERKVATYRIRNAGQGILRIVRIRKGCGCATAESNRDVIRHGEEAEIKVVILANSIVGQYSKNTYVETSDPNNRYVRLVVSGNAVPLVQVKPEARVSAGRIPESQQWTQVFQLVPTEEGVRLARIIHEAPTQGLNRA